MTNCKIQKIPVQRYSKPGFRIKAAYFFTAVFQPFSMPPAD